MEKGIQIWHNTRCSKSRDAIAYLEEKKVEYHWVDYLKIDLSEDDLVDITRKLNILPQDLMRKKEPIFVEKFAGKKLTPKAAIKAMLRYPQLIERPIVVKGDKAVIARPLDELDTLFN